LSNLLSKNIANRLVAVRIENQSSSLKALLQSSKILAVPGVFDGMTAWLAQKAGFEALLELAEIVQGGARVDPFGDRNIANLIDSEAYLND
jgi:hypothetical protein